MANEFNFNREKLIRIFFFAAFALLVYQLFKLAQPFLTALLMAFMLALAFYPFYQRLHRFLKNPTGAALLMTLIVFLLAIIPLTMILWFLFREADRLLPTFQAFMADLEHLDRMSLKERLPSFLALRVDSVFNLFNTVQIDPEQNLARYVGAVGAWITALGGLAARHAFLGLVNIVVLFIALFFAFRDGENLLQWFLSLVPMEASHKKALARRAYETFMAVVIGVFITASAQGLTAIIGFYIGGVKLPVLLGVATTIMAFFGASFIVTIPVAISMFNQSLAAGIFLLIWGALVVGLMDNFLKPMLIGSRARMPFVLIFFSIIGGLKEYGLLGVILGPIIVASFLTFVSIYRRGYGTTDTEDWPAPRSRK